MKHCDYQILEYASSELQASGVPFLVVVRLREQNSSTLKAFILRQWKTKVGVLSKEDLSEVETFLLDLEVQTGGQIGSDAFFEQSASLNVGPVRSSVSGSCYEQDLIQVIEVFFDVAPESASWQEQFTQLG
jgi:hypothetical protein